MPLKITAEDLCTIKSLAKKYDASPADFCKAAVQQIRKEDRPVERQIRISEDEKLLLESNARVCGKTVSGYVEEACNSFLSAAVINEKFFRVSVYGTNRTQRISVQFRSAETESKILNFASEYGINISAFIRYCALNYRPANCHKKPADHQRK